MKEKIVNSEIEITIAMIGGKYKPLILYYLIEDGVHRFHELMERIPSISQRTLTNQLREMEHDQLIERKVYPEVPPKVEYTISAKGASLFPILDAMCTWGFENNHGQYVVTHPQCEECEPQ
ncbi:MAG: winged helix-turn-helix transcriptional regulator [Erysipelotrichaceae bacterium]